MDKSKVIIRVDGNSKIGLGHIYRGIALAEMLEDEFNISFITKKTSTTSPIVDAEFEIKYIPDEIKLTTEPNYLNNTFKKDTIIVLDGYDFDEGYQQNIKDYGFKLVFIDDLAKGIQKADLIINHSPGAKETDYSKEDYSKLALGLGFALLRKPFLSKSRINFSNRDKIEKVFVSFGGADINDYSFKATINVLEGIQIKRVNVVLGSAYNHTSILKLESPKLKIHKNISANKIFELMTTSDLAVVPASTTSIELASVGVPMILGYSAENQRQVYKGFVEKNSVYGIGDYSKFDFKKLTELINSVKDSKKLNKKKVTLKELFKGNPKNNIIKAFSFFNLTIRQANMDDMIFVYNLSNDIEVRKNSYISNKIELEKHKNWFRDKINNTLVTFYIIEYLNIKIAQVRIDIKNDYSIIGISLINEFRGKGLSSEILIKTTKEYFKQNSKPIYAYIKKVNELSINSFKKAGFLFLKREMINNIESFIYKKEKN